MADHSGLLADLDALAPMPGRTKCHTALILEQLDEEARSVVEAKIDDQTIHASVLADVLTRNGHPVHGDSVRRHRRRGTAGGCKCPRTREDA